MCPLGCATPAGKTAGFASPGDPALGPARDGRHPRPGIGPAGGCRRRAPAAAPPAPPPAHPRHGARRPDDGQPWRRAARFALRRSEAPQATSAASTPAAITAAHSARDRPG